MSDQTVSAMKRLVCVLIGHDIQVPVANPFQPLWCARCEKRYLWKNGWVR